MSLRVDISKGPQGFPKSMDIFNRLRRCRGVAGNNQLKVRPDKVKGNSGYFAPFIRHGRGSKGIKKRSYPPVCIWMSCKWAVMVGNVIHIRWAHVHRFGRNEILRT